MKFVRHSSHRPVRLLLLITLLLAACCAALARRAWERSKTVASLGLALDSRLAELQAMQLSLAQERNDTNQARARLKEVEGELKAARSRQEQLVKERDAAAAAAGDKEKRLQEKEAQLDKVSQEQAAAVERARNEAKEDASAVVKGAKQEASQARADMDAFLEHARAGVYADSLPFRAQLEAQAPALRARWEAQLAAQRPRGIVMPAGGSVGRGTITAAFITLHVLRRHLRCTLPVAIMYLGNFPLDRVDSRTIAFFKEHLADVEFIDASTLPQPQHHRPLYKRAQGEMMGFKIKVFSLYAAPFREVLLLDADSMPLLDPSPLFELPQYQQHGNLFWPDFMTRDIYGFSNTPLFNMFQLESPWAAGNATLHHTESGQFLFNRPLLWPVLEWLLFINLREEVVYRSTHGDKETFRLAFHLAGNASSFQQVALPPAFLISNLRFKGILQLHPNGTVFFSHRTPMKDKAGGPPLPPSTHASAGAAAANLAFPAANFVLSQELKEDWVMKVTTDQCDYSLWDWPAAYRGCAPSYDPDAPRQRLPIFELPPGTHLAAAEAAAAEGLALLSQAKPP